MEFITTNATVQNIIQQHQMGKTVIGIPYDFKEYPDNVPDASLAYTQPGRMSRNTGHEDDYGNKLMLEGTDLVDEFQDSLQRDLQDWFSEKVEVRICEPTEEEDIEAEEQGIIIFCLYMDSENE